jgi:hypothetical protein
MSTACPGRDTASHASAALAATKRNANRVRIKARQKVIVRIGIMTFGFMAPFVGVYGADELSETAAIPRRKWLVLLSFVGARN